MRLHDGRRSTRKWSAFAVFLIGVRVLRHVGDRLRGPRPQRTNRRPNLGDYGSPDADVGTCHGGDAGRGPWLRVGRSQDYGVIALAFTILFAGTTSVVHFVELTALRQLGSAGIVWPSTVYAVELLAWNLFLGLSLLFAAPVFAGVAESGVRRGLFIGGVLCVAGTVGPVVGNMRIQLIGVVGYAGVLPVVAFMLTRLFRRDGRPRQAKPYL